MTTQTKAADPMREARERFEKWCSDRGIASNYQGDGQYPAGVQLAFEAHMDAYAQAPRPCSCHPDDRPRGPCREKYAASECQAPAANGDAQ